MFDYENATNCPGLLDENNNNTEEKKNGKITNIH